MSICQKENLVLVIVLINSLLAEANNISGTITTSTEDPANVDINTANIAEIERFEKVKKQRPEIFQNNRIIGGTATTIQVHPFIVSLQMIGGSHMCGGTLVHVLWVLSASHCITIGEDSTLRDPSDYVIVAGLSDITRVMDYGQSREIHAFIKHPRFTKPFLFNDIGLIKLKNPLNLDKTVQLVNLPAFYVGHWDLSNRYDHCTALGWGAQRPRLGIPYDQLTEQEKLDIEDDTISPILNEVDLPVISIKYCQDRINNEYITYRHVCTMYAPGGKDACEGDSGGPLMCGDQQHGITSWGHGCALPGTPGVFTRVETFTGWINNVINHGRNYDPYNSSTKVVHSSLNFFVSMFLLIKKLL